MLVSWFACFGSHIALLSLFANQLRHFRRVPAAGFNGTTTLQAR
jgi:hypothetical protein